MMQLNVSNLCRNVTKIQLEMTTKYVKSILMHLRRFRHPTIYSRRQKAIDYAVTVTGAEQDHPDGVP